MRMTKLLTFLCAIGLIDFVRAELPPSAYKERQEKAPEALVIKVTSVNKRETRVKEGASIEFTVKAAVERVERSATKLEPGALIEIYYIQKRYSQPIAGPSEVPSLKEGQVCPAYLSKTGDTYSPAAGGYSFETVH